MTPGENRALLAKEKDCCGIVDGQGLPRPSQFPLRPSWSTKKTHHFRLFNHLPVFPLYLSSFQLHPGAQLSGPLLTELTSVLPKPATLLMAFLSQQMATPSIGLRQKGGGLPRLFPLPDSPRSLFSSSCLLWVSVVVQELSLVVVCGLLFAAASLVEHRL